MLPEPQTLTPRPPAGERGVRVWGLLGLLRDGLLRDGLLRRFLLLSSHLCHLLVCQLTALLMVLADLVLVSSDTALKY